MLHDDAARQRTVSPRRSALVTMLLMGILSACSGLRHGATTLDYQGQLLRVRATGPGAERLDIESDYDASVRHYVQDNGKPDLLLVVDSSTVQLIYLDADRVVQSKRGGLSPNGALQAAATPATLDAFLDIEELQRLQRARAARAESAAPMPADSVGPR